MRQEEYYTLYSTLISLTIEASSQFLETLTIYYVSSIT